MVSKCLLILGKKEVILDSMVFAIGLSLVIAFSPFINCTTIDL